jgi:excisionase family DNA binding protein
MNDVFMTTDEVLEYLQVNLRTVYRLINAGKIPAIRVGRQWRFRKPDIDSWLEGHRSAGSSEPGPVPSPRHPAEPTSPHRARILVADDEAGIRELLSKSLALAEYDVEAVGDGRKALERLRAGSHDLLVTDLKMPGIDGLSLIRDAKRLAPDLPIIVITGYSTESSAIEAINLGVAGYLTKPFRIARFLSATARALGE